MAREDPQIKLRLPADLKAAVDDAAKGSSRSVNAEIVLRLRQSFNPKLPLGMDAPPEFASEEEVRGEMLRVADYLRLLAVSISEFEDNPNLPKYMPPETKDSQDRIRRYRTRKNDFSAETQKKVDAMNDERAEARSKMQTTSSDHPSETEPKLREGITRFGRPAKKV